MNRDVHVPSQLSEWKNLMNIFVGNRTSFLKPFFENNEDIHFVFTEVGSPLDIFCKLKKIPTKYFKNKTSLLALLEIEQFDALYSAGCPYILPHQLVKQEDKRFINVHPSLLPEFSGMHSITAALYHEGPFGVTIHLMGEEVDTGRLVAQKEFKLSAQFNAKKAFEQFFAEEEKLVSDSLKTGKFEPNNLKHLPFIPSKSDYPTFKRDESFRKIGAWMTIDEIVKRVFVLNIENHYAFIQKEEKKRFIRNVISYSNLNDVEWGENLVVFKAKNGKIGLEFFSDLET